MSDRPRSEKFEADNLEALSKNPSQMQVELADQLGIDKATIGNQPRQLNKIRKIQFSEDGCRMYCKTLSID